MKAEAVLELRTAMSNERSLDLACLGVFRVEKREEVPAKRIDQLYRAKRCRRVEELLYVFGDWPEHRRFSLVENFRSHSNAGHHTDTFRIRIHIC